MAIKMIKFRLKIQHSLLKIDLTKNFLLASPISCISALRFYVLEPGQDVHDVGQLTRFTNTILHENTEGNATNVIFDNFDGYDHAPTLVGNTKWFSYRFTDEEYVCYVRIWPCFCTFCLGQDWDHCVNVATCGPWIKKTVAHSDFWIQSSATPLQRARQYQKVALIPSQDSDASDYEVERILAKRTTIDTAEYLVKWRGWDQMYNQWLPERDLADSTNLIRRFNRRVQSL